MRNELELIEKIDNYLTGNLSIEEIKVFEQEIESNPELQAKVEHQRLIIQAIKRQGIKNDINKASNAGRGKFWGFSGFIVVLAIVAFFFLKPASPTNNEISQDTTPTQDSIESANGYELLSVIETFKGLDTWVKPDVQLHNFKAEEGVTIEGKNGTLVIVPSNSILDQNNNPVKGNVDLELVEALTLDDMVLYNLTTIADDKFLETGGMIFVNATQNGMQVKINPERPLYIEIPTNEVKKEMMVFNGEVTSEGNINWKDPKPLQKFLVQVDFKNLDFLPKGFAQTFYNESPTSNFYTRDLNKIDSTYYSLGYDDQLEDEAWEDDSQIVQIKTEVQKDRYIIIERENDAIVGLDVDTASEVGEKPVEDITCGVDPLTIKTIRTKEFEQTFLATREFEERLKYIHLLDNGQEVIDIYINNLKKQLWEIDKMAASKATGKFKKKFNEFAAQKLTNLKDAKIYQDRLSNFYNSKKEENSKDLIALKNELRKKDKKELNKLSNELAELKRRARNDFNQNVQRKINKSIAFQAPRNSVANSNVYAFQWAQFGWANIDRYMKLINIEPKIIEIEAINPKPKMKVYQWLNTINTLTPLVMNENTCQASFPKKGNRGSHKMSNTYCFAISRENDQFYWAKKNFNPYKVRNVEINLEPAELADIKSKLAALSSSNEPLIKSLKTAQEELEIALKEKKEAEIKRKEWVEKQKVIQEKYKAFEKNYTVKKEREIAQFKLEQNQHHQFIEKLKKICFPCFQNKPSAPLSDDPVYSISMVEETPSWKGCEGRNSNERSSCTSLGMMRYMSSNVKYPKSAKEAGTSGKVYVDFVISASGKVTDVKIKRGIGNGCDEEAIRVVQSFPDFNPGKLKGQPVRVSFTTPIIFKLY